MYSNITINGASIVHGIADLSIDRGPDGVMWMAYSNVELPAKVSTHLAKSTDNGATWDFVQRINESSLGIGVNGYVGYWRHETPSIRYDAHHDEWVLVWNLYFSRFPFGESESIFDQGAIVSRRTNNPARWWSEPQRMINGTLFPGLQVPQIHPSLVGYRFLMEPGIHIDGNHMYLVADACTTPTGLGDWENRKIVLLRSSNKGQTWSYIGEISNFADALAKGYAAFTGAAIVQHDDEKYLALSPSGSIQGANQGHDGVMVIPLEGWSPKRVNGQLDVVNHIPQIHTNGGLGDYHESMGSVVMHHIELENSPVVFVGTNSGHGLRG